MWRAIPLIKIVLRMVAFGALLGASLGLVTVVAFESTVPEPKSQYQLQIVLGGVKDGVLLAGLAGIAMASYAGIVHRTVHKPAHFRFAMLIVATIVTLVVVQHPFHIVSLSEFGIRLVDWVPWALQRGRPGVDSSVLRHHCQACCNRLDEPVRGEPLPARRFGEFLEVTHANVGLSSTLD